MSDLIPTIISVAKFYWQTLSGNWDWTFDIYFGKTRTVGTA